MAPPLLFLKDIRLTFGGTPLLAGAELSIGPFERLCLVGRNGSGKSTLLKIAAGMIEPDAGTRFVQPSVTIRYLPQSPDLSGFATTSAFVEAGLAPGDDPHRARYLLESLGLTGAEDPAHLSGGESRRAALARVLAPEPDILLLDEPTNHLDVVAIEGLEAVLKASRSAMVLISHDRRFLENLSEATVWLDRGITRRLDKGFAGFEAWRDAILEAEELAGHKLDRRIVQEEHWLRYGVSARRKRNQRRLEGLIALRGDRRRDLANRPSGDVKLTVQEARETGKKVIEARRIAKSYGDLTVVRDFSIKIARGDRIGIVGPNGAGKTTLINLLTGALPPDTGSVQLGTNLEIATLDQKRESLDPEASVATILTGGSGDQVIIDGESRHVIGYMKDFLVQAGAGAHAGQGAVGWRARAAALGPGTGATLQSHGAGRADQRPRSRDARPLAGDARRLSRNAHSRQPRPRLPRPHRHLGDRLRGRGEVDRICGRLFRHGGAARGRRGRAAVTREAASAEIGASRPSRRRGALRAAQAPQPHRATCLEDRAGPHRGSSRGDPPAGGSARRSRLLCPRP